MPKRSKATTKKHTPLVFPERVTVRLAPDVRDALNNSAVIVDWDDFSHAINAGLRQGTIKFAKGRIEITPFEQMAFYVPNFNRTAK